MRILGIDPSYKRIGFAIVENNRLLYSISLDLRKIKTKREKREKIKRNIYGIEVGYRPDKIVVERTRLYSRGFISTKTIIALSSLITTIIDATELDVYSVDSRSFKARVIGRASCSKEDVINWVKSKYDVSVNEDQADAIAIALYPFVDKPLLRKEND